MNLFKRKKKTLGPTIEQVVEENTRLVHDRMAFYHNYVKAALELEEKRKMGKEYIR